MFITNLLMAATLTLSPVQAPTHTPIHATSVSTQRSWNSTMSVWSHYPKWVHTFGLCVAHHESWNAGLWTALNQWSGSGASGAFQYLDSTWRVHAQRAHIGTQYRKAMYAPAKVQVAVFAYNVYYKHAQRAWWGTHCGYGT